MIQITPSITIHESELQEEFIRSSGPGGQNVNKVSTAVRLRFDVLHSPSIPEDVRQRLMKIAHGRITEEGVLIIDSRQFRTQIANRDSAVKRLLELIVKAAERPKVHRKTRPTLGSKLKRLDTKRHQADAKKTRRTPDSNDA